MIDDDRPLNARTEAVRLARAVIDMDNEIFDLQGRLAAAEEYREKYFELLNGSIAHNREMMGGLFQIAMTPGVLEAMGKRA